MQHSVDPVVTLFDRLTSEGEPGLHRLLQSAEPEHDFLDFKRIDTPPQRLRKNKLGSDDYRNLGKAISGFHNLYGGVVVWGIDCSWESDAADRTCVPGVEDGDLVVSVLRDKISVATRNPVSGILFKTVPLTSGRWAVLMYIPSRGDGLPVESRTDKPGYFFRAGESFLPVPPDLLASMFGRAPPARCSVEIVGAIDGDPAVAAAQLVLDVFMRNDGRGMGRDIYTKITWFRPGPNCEVSKTMKNLRIGSLPSTPDTEIAMGQPDVRLPPGATAGMIQLCFQFHPPIRSAFRLEVQGGAGSGLPTYKSWVVAEAAIKALMAAPRTTSFHERWEAALDHEGSYQTGE